MLEMMMGGKTDNGVYLDVSFEDAVLGSSDIYDKVTGSKFITVKSTGSGSTDVAAVVDHATYGRIMQVRAGHRWYLPVFPTANLKNLIIEIEFYIQGVTGQSPLISSGGPLNGSYAAGFAYTVRGGGSYAYGMSYYPENSGSSANISGQSGMQKHFIEYEPNGDILTYGLRGVTPVSGRNYAPQINTGLYLFGTPDQMNYLAEKTPTLGLLKSIKMYKKQ